MRHFVTRSDIHAFGHEVEGSDITAIDRLCWRGDSRHPREIFAFGFRRRDDTAEGYFRRKASWQDDAAGSDSDSEDEVPLAIPNRMPPSGALFRIAQKDIAPATAVCVSGNFKAAALFPLKGEEDPAEDVTWIYAVNVQNGFETYQMQAKLGATQLAFAQEACSHDIPPMHVLGAVKMRREWMGPTWKAGALGRVLKPFRENQRSVGCVARAAKLDAARQEIARSLKGNRLTIGS